MIEHSATELRAGVKQAVRYFEIHDHANMPEVSFCLSLIRAEM